MNRDELCRLSHEAERNGDRATARVWGPGESPVEGRGKTIQEALEDALRRRGSQGQIRARPVAR